MVSWGLVVSVVLVVVVMGVLLSFGCSRVGVSGSGLYFAEEDRA